MTLYDQRAKDISELANAEGERTGGLIEGSSREGMIVNYGACKV